MRKFVNSFTWTQAKTYANKAPHSYIVVKQDHPMRKEFEEVVQYIRDTGFRAYFYKKAFIYFYLDDYFYWTMGAPMGITIVLNRAKISEYELIDNHHWQWKGSDNIGK
jgi:hypothetical protein